jgi:transposase
MCIKGCISAARVHFLRDGHDLKEQYPDEQEVHQWAKDVKAVYERAIA